MIDEWISAPYSHQKADRPAILSCLKWIDGESQKRFQKRFTQLSIEQKHAICDDICYARNRAVRISQTGAELFAISIVVRIGLLRHARGLESDWLCWEYTAGEIRRAAGGGVAEIGLVVFGVFAFCAICVS